MIDIPSQDGRVALVTGANTGIGRVTALELARAGAHTILACRSTQKGQEAVDAIHAETGNDKVELLQLDLGSFDAVRKSAEDFLSRDLPLHILINNAGLAGPRGLTTDGFEIAFGVNHLAPSLFTLLLLPKLRESAPARIVMVASRAHMRVKKGIDFDAVRKTTRTRTAFDEYSVSKLANIFFTQSLATHLEGSGVTVNALHPGVVASDIWRKVPQPIRWVAHRFMITNEEGAEPSLAAATDPARAHENGLYYDRLTLRKPASSANNPELQQKLWEKTLEWTGAPEP